MILKGISVNQNPPTKDYLWITPKGNTRFWNQSTWMLIGGNGGGGSGNLPVIESAGKYLVTTGTAGNYSLAWGDINLSNYINGTSGYAAIFNSSNSIISAIGNNSKMRIGDGIIEWDSTNKGFKIYNATSTQETPTTAGIYADWVSALGPNSSGGGGGGSDLDWGSLITWDEDPTHIINIDYLPVDLNDGVIAIGNNSITPVTSVAMTVPTGFTISGSPITKTGTLALGYNNGYEGFTTDLKNKINDLYSWFEVDNNGNVKTKDKPNNGGHRGFYSESFISALGLNSSGGGGGGGISETDLWIELTDNSGWLTTDPKIIARNHLPINGASGNSGGQTFYAPTSGGSNGQYLRWPSSGNIPYWDTLDASDIPNLSASKIDSGTFDAARIPTLSITDKTSGTLPITRGGTGKTSWDAYKVLYASAANTLGQLSHASSTSYLLKSGSSSAAPSWIQYATGNVASSIVQRDSNAYISATSYYALNNKTNGVTASKFVFSDTPSTNSEYAAIYASYENYGGRINFRQYSGSSSARTSYYELYKLPQTNASLTATKTYNILTDKDLSFSITGNAATASKLGTSSVGNAITPFYLNGGVTTVCDIYRYHYDSTSDWSSYAWHKVATAEATVNTDKVITFLVTRGDSANVNGILRCRARWGSDGASTPSPVYSTAQINWVVNNGIPVADFVLVWKSPYVELWCKIPTQWGGYQFTVLSSGNRASGSILTWILNSNGDGHGSASYTSDGTVITSTNATLINNINGTVNDYSISSTINAGTANRLAYYTSSGIDDANTTYVSNTKLAINSTSEPSYNFYVNGTSYLNGQTNTQNIVPITNSTYNIGASNNVYSNIYSNNYIVNTGSATSGLYKNSSITSSGTSTTLWLYNSNLLKLYGSAINLNSNVGIGTDSPAYKLDVSGVIHSTTGIWSDGYVSALGQNSSDKRLKKNIKQFEAKSIIDKLKPVEFEWNKKANKYNSNLELNKKNYGLIAQDSDGIIDDLVFDLPDGKGYKGVRYEKLIPILLQAVKEQQKEIDELKQIIKKLKV